MMKGFTLVETLVAITILMLAIAGPFHAVQVALVNSNTARDQLVAASLAQEGMEYVRFVRDSNYINNLHAPSSAVSWFYGLDGTGGSDNCVGASAYCTIDPTQSTVLGAINTCSGTCSPLNLSTTNLYTQSAPSGYVVTRFTRTLQLIQISSTEMQATVTVSWSSGHTPYTMVITENLQDWL